MKPLGSRRAHYWLLLGMAQRSGADAETSFASGETTEAAWADLVEACRGCSAPDACRRFLECPQAERRSPPAFCQNAQALAKMPRCAEEESV